MDTYGGWDGMAEGHSAERTPPRSTARLRFARYVAKNVVASGLAPQCEVQAATRLELRTQ